MWERKGDVACTQGNGYLSRRSATLAAKPVSMKYLLFLSYVPDNVFFLQIKKNLHALTKIICVQR